MPTLPNYVRSKTANLALAGIVLAQYGLWQAIFRLPLGIGADWLGRQKPLIIVGFALSGSGALIMGAAKGVGQLAVGRAIIGISAATWVPLVVVFSSFYPADQVLRATTVLVFVSSIARMLSTSVTGRLNALGGYGLAFFLATGAAVLAICAILPTQERRRAPQRPSMKGVGRLITRSDVLLPALLAAVSQYTQWTATFGFMPILARDLGATDNLLSALLTMHIGVATLGNLLATAIVGRIGARRLVYVSMTMLSAAVGLAAIAPSLAVVFVAQFWMGVSQGIGYPLLMGLSIRYVADANRTTAMGLHQAVYAIGMFTGPWISGMVADVIGLQPMFAATATVCLILGLVFARRLSPNS
jgi:MFS family permease